eukprot:355106-Chlamydomonas_euryale.AAC.1
MQQSGLPTCWAIAALRPSKVWLVDPLRQPRIAQPQVAWLVVVVVCTAEVQRLGQVEGDDAVGLRVLDRLCMAREV